MEIGRDQNEKSSYEVKEGPGDREADEQAEDRLEPLRGHVSGPDRGGPPAKTVRAQKLSLMLGHAFPAEIMRAGRTAGNRCPVRMGQTSLKSEVHLGDFGEKSKRGNQSQITQTTGLRIQVQAFVLEGGGTASCADRISGSMVAMPLRKSRILSKGAIRWV
jgi:hypothetical protein